MILYNIIYYNIVKFNIMEYDTVLLFRFKLFFEIKAIKVVKKN